MSLNRLARAMDLLGERITTNTNSAVKLVGAAVNQTVILATPVDTGQARNNWRLSFDVPLDDTVGAPVNTPNNISAGSRDFAGTGRIAANNAILALRSEDRRQDVFISNNLPYIGALNNGRSAQAPAGFVEMAVLAGIRALRGTRITR